MFYLCVIVLEKYFISLQLIGFYNKTIPFYASLGKYEFAINKYTNWLMYQHSQVWEIRGCKVHNSIWNYGSLLSLKSING